MDSSFLEAYLAGELDEYHRGQVETVLLRDAELRTTFFQQMRMDAALRVILGAGAGGSDTAAVPVSDETFRVGVLAHLRSEGAGDARSFAKSVLTEIVVEREGKRLLRWPDLVIAGAVSAAASIGLMFVLQSVDFNAEARSAARPFVARFESGGSGIATPRWSGEGTGGLHADGWMPAGEFALGEGRALLAFNSGATALLEGPARFRLESSNRLFLHGASGVRSPGACARLYGEYAQPDSGGSGNAFWNHCRRGGRFGTPRHGGVGGRQPQQWQYHHHIGARGQCGPG